MPASLLIDQLTELRFQHHLEQASLVSEHPDSDERTEAALTILRELAVCKLYEELSRKQLGDIYLRLKPLLATVSQDEDSCLSGDEMGDRTDKSQ